jgi:hypothetical protein
MVNARAVASRNVFRNLVIMVTFLLSIMEMQLLVVDRNIKGKSLLKPNLIIVFGQIKNFRVSRKFTYRAGKAATAIVKNYW